MFALSATGWSFVAGDAEKFVSRLLIPLLAAGIYLLFLSAPRFDPFCRSSLELGGNYQVARLTVTVFMFQGRDALASRVGSGGYDPAPPSWSRYSGSPEVPDG